MLLAFRADVNILNKCKRTPLNVYLDKHSGAKEDGDEEDDEEEDDDNDEVADLLKSYRAVLENEDQAVKPFVPILQNGDEKEAETSLISSEKVKFTEEDWYSSMSKTYYDLEVNLKQLLLDRTFLLASNLDRAAAACLQMSELMQFQKCGSRMLFIDGGGMKGLMQVDILYEIEKRTGRKIIELFDWIVGTSVGAVIAMALVHGKKSFNLADLLWSCIM